MNILRWLQCQDCGAEYVMSARQNCDACAGPVHERTAHDGATPTKLVEQITGDKPPEPGEPLTTAQP